MDNSGVMISEIATYEARIFEMVFENSLITVPTYGGIDIDTIVADDPNPMFVNVEVIRSGISKVNNRKYNNQIVKQINDMIPGTHGFFGHPDPSKYGFEFREPQCIYVGSVLDTMQDGSLRSIGKAYIFKSSQLREWIPKSIAANNPMTVSINGMGDVVRNGDYIDVINMTELQSIDWANPGTEGVETSKAMAVVSEMQDNNNNGGIDKMSNELNAKDIIKSVTVTEFKAYNPDGFKGVIESIGISELRDHNPSLVKSIEDSARITEMSLTIGGEQKTVKITELQGILTDYEKNIATLNGQVQDAKITELKAQKIAALVPEGMRDKIAPRITGTDDASIEASIKAEIDYVREMGGNVNKPIGRNININDDDDLKNQIAGMFQHKENK